MMSVKNSVIEGQELLTLVPQEIKWAEQGYKIVIPGINNTGIAIDEKLLARHILCLGSIGSGKSVTMYHIIDRLRKAATKDDIFIFFDAKGDYVEKFYEHGDYVISNKLDPPAGTVYWNLYEDVMSFPEEERENVIREICTLLFKEDIENSSSPIFATGARDLLSAIISVHVRDMEHNGTIWDHEKLVEWIRSATDVTIRNLLLPYKDLKWVRNYIDKNNSSATIQSFIIHLYQTIFNVFSGGFAKPGTFSIKRALKEKNRKAVFLEYDIANGNILKPMYTLMLDLAMKDVLGQERLNGNVYFILDEFPLIPKLKYMDNALNFGRSLGVKVIAGLQNVGQVEYVYGETLGRSIVSGFGTIFSFRLFDEASRNVVIERHGKNRKVINLLSTNLTKGIQDNIIEGRVIEDCNIVGLQIGQCIVSPFNGEPFMFLPTMYNG